VFLPVTAEAPATEATQVDSGVHTVELGLAKGRTLSVPTDVPAMLSIGAGVTPPERFSIRYLVRRSAP
jgi:hypothetical protein